MPEDAAPPAQFITPSPMGMASRPARQVPDPDRFQTMARRLAMENYNRTRDRDKFPDLPIEAFYIVWYNKTMNHWRATVESAKATRLSWSITYNGAEDECYIVVWKKLTKITVAMGEDTE
jgi:hypothetical protein